MKNKLLLKESIFGDQRTPYTIPKDGSYKLMYDASGEKIILSVSVTKTNEVVKYKYNKNDKFYKSVHYLSNGSFGITQVSDGCVEEIYATGSNQPEKRYVNGSMVMFNKELKSESIYDMEAYLREKEEKVREAKELEDQQLKEEEKERKKKQEQIKIETELEKEALIGMVGQEGIKWNEELIGVIKSKDLSLRKDSRKDKLRRHNPKNGHTSITNVNDYESDDALFLRKVMSNNEEDLPEFQKHLAGAEIWSIIKSEYGKVSVKDVLLRYEYDDGYRIALIEPDEEPLSDDYIYNDLEDYCITERMLNTVEVYRNNIYEEFLYNEIVYTENCNASFYINNDTGGVEEGIVLGIAYESYGDGKIFCIDGNEYESKKKAYNFKIVLDDEDHNNAILVFDYLYRLIEAKDYYEYDIKIDYKYCECDSGIGEIESIKRIYKDYYIIDTYENNKLVSSTTYDKPKRKKKKD